MRRRIRTFAVVLTIASGCVDRHPIGRNVMRSRRALFLRVGLVSFVALAAMTITSPIVRGAAQHVRWDIISLNFPPASPLTTLPGGHASALANDGSKITLTGSG